jgi:hypothetical protein
MEWNDDISGKTSKQREFKLNHITGGKFTPREFGGTQFFDSKVSFLS